MIAIIFTRCQATTVTPFRERWVQGPPSSLHISPANCLDANQVFYVGCCLTLSTKFLIAPLVRNVSTEEWSNLCVFPFVNSQNSVPKPCCDASVSSFKVHLNTQIFLVLKICFFIILPQKSWLNPVLSMPCCSRASLLRPVYTCDFCRSNLMLKTILQRFGCNSLNGNNFEQRYHSLITAASSL